MLRRSLVRAEAHLHHQADTVSIEILQNDQGNVLLGWNFTDEAVASFFIGHKRTRLGQPMNCRDCKNDCGHYGGFKGIARAIGHVLVGKDEDGKYVNTRVALTVLSTPKGVKGVVVDPDPASDPEA
jgi:hypothetical protein